MLARQWAVLTSQPQQKSVARSLHISTVNHFLVLSSSRPESLVLVLLDMPSAMLSIFALSFLFSQLDFSAGHVGECPSWFHKSYLTLTALQPCSTPACTGLM